MLSPMTVLPEPPGATIVAREPPPSQCDRTESRAFRWCGRSGSSVVPGGARRFPRARAPEGSSPFGCAGRRARLTAPRPCTGCGA
eukprot:5120947-Prymnesium_polylepis.1